MSEGGYLSDEYRRLFDQAGVDAAIAAVMAANHAVLGLEGFAALGVGPRAVQHRARSGHLHRAFRSVYSIVPTSLLSREGWFMAAVLACGPGAVLSHRSAAALLGLRPTSRSGIDVTVRGRVGRKHPGVDVHRSTTLTAADVTVVHGIPCTTIARTMLDIAEVIRERQLERVFEQAEQEEVLNFRALEDQIDRNSTRVGAKRVRALMARYTAGMGVTWSELERDFQAMIAPAGIPMPLVNHCIVLPDGEPAIRPDFSWPQQRAVVQTDGWRSHKSWAAFQRDRRSDQRLIAADYPVTRMTHQQIHTEPDRLNALIWKMLSRPSGRSSAPRAS